MSILIGEAYYNLQRRPMSNEYQIAKQQLLRQRLLNGDHMLTPEEVAATLRVQPKTVLAWIRKSRLAAVTTPGNKKLIPASAIEELFSDWDDTT